MGQGNFNAGNNCGYARIDKILAKLRNTTAPEQNISTARHMIGKSKIQTNKKS